MGVATFQGSRSTRPAICFYGAEGKKSLTSSPIVPSMELSIVIFKNRLTDPSMPTNTSVVSFKTRSTRTDWSVPFTSSLMEGGSMHGSSVTTERSKMVIVLTISQETAVHSSSLLHVARSCSVLIMYCCRPVQVGGCPTHSPGSPRENDTFNDTADGQITSFFSDFLLNFKNG